MAPPQQTGPTGWGWPPALPPCGSWLLGSPENWATHLVASAPTWHSAKGGGGWRPDSGSTPARPWRCSYERGARPGRAGPLEARVAIPAALELVVGEPATGLARCRDRLSRTSCPAMSAQVLGFLRN